MHFFYASCRISSLILDDRGVMRNFGLVSCFYLLTVCILLFACGSDRTTSTPNPRTIAVTIKNLEARNSVHVYVDLEEPSEEKLVLPQDSIIAQILTRHIGWSVTVYVSKGDKSEAPAFYSTNVRVTQTSWDSREAEL